MHAIFGFWNSMTRLLSARLKAYSNGLQSLTTIYLGELNALTLNVIGLSTAELNFSEWTCFRDHISLALRIGQSIHEIYMSLTRMELSACLGRISGLPMAESRTSNLRLADCWDGQCVGSIPLQKMMALAMV
jgi:hypothetical protein